MLNVLDVKHSCGTLGSDLFFQAQMLVQPCSKIMNDTCSLDDTVIHSDFSNPTFLKLFFLLQM